MKNFYHLILIILFSSTQSFSQWIKTNGPEGITVTSFFEGDSVLLCGTYAQGVFRSSDNGSTWTISNQGLQNKWIDCFTNDDSYIYAGCFGEGVFRSSDNGLTWQTANSGIQSQAVVSLIENDGSLYAGTVGSGIYRSVDQGNTWFAINGGALGSSFIKAITYQSPRLMVEADNYIFYSTDTGATWNVDQGTTQFYTINCFYQKGDTILAAAFSNLFYTVNGGITWSNPYSVNSSVVGFDEINDTLYAGTAEGVYKSSDWGVTWTFIPAAGLRPGASAFIISGGNMLLGREELGVVASADLGTSWSEIPLSQFSRASNIDNCIIEANGTLYTGTHGNGVFSTDNGGASWSKIGTSNIMDTLSSEIVFAMLHVQPNILFAGTCPDGLYRSADGGATWTHITAGLPQQTGTGYTCFKTLTECGPNILAALTDGVYYSSDVGLTWHPTNLTGSTVLQTGGFAVRGNIACVGVIGFGLQTGVYRSTDYGVTWTLADPILDIEVMATGGNHTMYCGELFTSYVSNDDGLSWNGMGIGATFTILAWNNYVFVGNNDGILFSNNYGASFTPMNQGMDPYPNNAVQGLARDAGYIYAGTYRDAIWKRPLTDFGIATGVDEQQSSDIIIAPNPASSFINVVGLNNGGDLMITDALGKTVYQSIVTHFVDEMRIDVAQLKPGIYFLKISNQEQSVTRKFVKN